MYCANRSRTRSIGRRHAYAAWGRRVNGQKVSPVGRLITPTSLGTSASQTDETGENAKVRSSSIDSGANELRRSVHRTPWKHSATPRMARGSHGARPVSFQSFRLNSTHVSTIRTGTAGRLLVPSSRLIVSARRVRSQPYSKPPSYFCLSVHRYIRFLERKVSNRICISRNSLRLFLSSTKDARFCAIFHAFTARLCPY